MSDQESSVFIGPFRDNENDCYLRQLWDRKLYRFLRSWFRTVEMDPTIGPDERGLTRIKKTDSGESWGIPPGDGNGMAYASYFKVIDASVSEEGEVLPKIRVVDGAHSSDPFYLFAGPVYVNGVRENDVPSYTIGVPVVDDEVADSRLWLIVARTEIDAECVLSFELRTDEDGEPDAVSGTFGYRYIPIARIIGSGGMSFRIVQDHYGPAIATFNTFSGYVVHADGGRTYVGPPTGVYLLVDIITGAARYDDAEPNDKSRMNFYLVAEKIDVENGVVYRPLDGITVGDVRIDFAPYAELPGWQQEET